MGTNATPLNSISDVCTNLLLMKLMASVDVCIVCSLRLKAELRLIALGDIASMSGLADRNETRSESTISDSSLSSGENDQASDDEELQRLLEQRSSSPGLRFSEEKLLNEFRSLYSESINISSLEQSGIQEATEDEKKVHHGPPRVARCRGAN